LAEPACSINFFPVIVCNALPAASQPTASIHTSAPNQSVAFFKNKTGSLNDSKLYASQKAKFLSKSNRYSTLAILTTRAAPDNQAHRADMMPTGPALTTYT